MVGGAAGYGLGGYLNQPASSSAADQGYQRSLHEDMDSAPDPAQQQRIADSQKLTDAVNKALDAMGLHQEPGNIYRYDPWFAGVNDPSFVFDAAWGYSVSDHGPSWESGPIPGVDPPLDLKFYNDPYRGLIMAPVTPTGSLYAPWAMWGHFNDWVSFRWFGGNPNLPHASQILEQLQ
jgi:hypothetical protein